MTTHYQRCGMSHTELQQLFNTGKDVDPECLQGCYRGNAYAIPIIAALPEPLRRLLHWLINALNIVWRGKSLQEGEGKNLWLMLSPRFGFAGYRYHVDQDGCLCLNYQKAENPQMLQGLHARLRRIDDSTLLGCVEISGRPRLFFSLSTPRHG